MGTVQGVEWLLAGLGLTVALAAAPFARAQGQEPEIAIRGYDPVAYFTLGAAVKGSEAFAFPWHGMIWQFASRENRDLFAAEPERYAPQYDGYCAWAMSEGRLARTDPEIWTIVEGKLYLNCSRAAYEKWSRDIPGNVTKADALWKEKFQAR